MTTIPFSRPSVLSQLVSAAAAALETFDRQMTVFRAQRDAADALYRLTDRELSDIGVARGNIEAAVRGARQDV